MAITSKRETILEYLRNTTLPLINGTGDYNLTIKTISRELRIADSMKAFELPAIFILDDTVTVYTPMTDREMVTGQSIIDLTTGWPVVFACMVAKPKTSGLDKAGLLSTEMNKMISDVFIAINSDTTLGGNCENIFIVKSVNQQQHDENEGIGIVVMESIVKYRFKPKATTPVT